MIRFTGLVQIDAKGDGMLTPAELRARRKRFGIETAPRGVERGRP